MERKGIHCQAKPVISTTQTLKRGRHRPIVLSAKRYNGILYRANQEAKLAQLAVVEEERKYRQYLKESSKALVQLFKGMKRAEEDSYEERMKPMMTQLHDVDREDLRLRKERIMRANLILENMKPGPRALQQALLESEMIHQRRYNEQLTREFAQAAEKQQQLEEEMCPEVLIPFTNKTAQQLEEEEKAKIMEVREAIKQDMEAKRQRVLDEKEQATFEGIAERAQYKCLQDKEEREARERAARKREACRQAYLDAVKEKKEIAEQERICDSIDDRRNCVFLVARRNLDNRYNRHVRKIRDQTIKEREQRAVEVCRMQQEGKRKVLELEEKHVERYDAEILMDEERRQCQMRELSKQRIAYQKEESRLAEEKRRKEFELRRFEITNRFKNAEANKLFEQSQKRKRDQKAADLRQVLHSQHEEFLEKRREEQMHISACDDDPNLEDDKYFFQQAVEVMKQSKKAGRPLFPIAKAVEEYSRENKLDMRPVGNTVHRSKLRDYCWPGYYSKAEAKYRQYERREMCREAQAKDHQEILRNCLIIKKMAAEERPRHVCKIECPIRCMHHRGMPPIDSTDSFDYTRYVCLEEEPPMGKCEADIAAKKEQQAKAERAAAEAESKRDKNPPPKEQHKLAVVPTTNQATGQSRLAIAPDPTGTWGSYNPPANAPQKPASTTSQPVSATGQNRPANVPDPSGTWGSYNPPANAPQKPTSATSQPATATGQNRPANVPDPSGTWGSYNPPANAPQKPASATTQPASATGQNRPANVPDPSGTWGSSSRPPAAPPSTGSQPTTAPPGGPPTGQNRLAIVPNPTGTWATS